MHLSPTAKLVLEKRYLRKNEQGKAVESPEELFQRVANSIAVVERLYNPRITEKELTAIARSFYELMSNLDFLPNSPTLMNAGRELNQLAACFVLPVEDSIEDIFMTIKNAALIHKSGGGTGFSFSRIRPKSFPVKSTGGVASGPVSFIRVFNAATEAIKQGGTRRGANIALLRVDHPDILEFITAKNKPGELTNFNISVALSDEFMKAASTANNYELVFQGKRLGTMNAAEILKLIAEQAWHNGEPGVIFLDTINAANPTPELGYIEATNPCGEQPLLPYEACILGSINLTNMVENGVVNWVKLEQAIRMAVRFLDNAIDAGSYPLPEITALVKGNRKIGLGVMGWANMLYKLFIPYDSDEALQLAEEVMSFIQRVARNSSRELAAARGNFPNINKSILQQPQRNATCTTIAPTGSISIIADTSPGIEPAFALAFSKQALEGELKAQINPVFHQALRENFSQSQVQEVLHEVLSTGSLANCLQLPKSWRRVFVTAREIAPYWHVRMQAAFQKHCDNAVSKTVNLPMTTTAEEILHIFTLAYQLGCKGITVYRSGSREQEALRAGI
ncbi:adenosylcobalamin-dependent ribonucleoside-diphosphate reductase [Zhaonella formicivorans]|uniref:adenosylcobalamin-dependent ribonucleoside-diphosphate reductase n=1 Tax=Zhaonella formicivorans TaxID=2528593 RepID=UPI0010D12AB0|nr:adenosylcobalamin-dependent ribonucleoside-diphosphate reductase [Zhaonella formicivorans]